MKNWKGKWIIGVALLHTVFALVVAGEHYQQMLRSGLINSATSPQANIAIWFLLFGVLLFIAGLLLLALEQAEQAIPRLAIYPLLGLTVLGVSVMPASGFWLMFPPLVALIIGDFQST